ncbi:hypothetical protein [Frankia sp. CiP3]|uniref:hypothetical protein n=1 Tax=Frankia sp. CiP3 TaxID=2880971 RepID=UPI001EF6CE72|nr:hypothetical protein [Frankia sp. CiP3]
MEAAARKRERVLAEVSQRDVAAAATGRLNESVFANPDLSPGQVTSLVDILREFRGRTGDF